MSKILWKDVARIVVDAFDVDIQLFYGRLLEKFRNTPMGDNFAAFAEKNPAAFEAFLRVLSAAVQTLPKDKNILTETVADHLQRLPVEIRRAMFGNGVTASIQERQSTTINVISDESFNLKYEEALTGLSDDQLRQVASLEKKQLCEWVNSPKQIRPFLLNKWKEESEKPGFMDNLRTAMENNAKDLEKHSESYLAHAKARYNQKRNK